MDGPSLHNGHTGLRGPRGRGPPQGPDGRARSVARPRGRCRRHVRTEYIIEDDAHATRSGRSLRKDEELVQQSTCRTSGKRTISRRKTRPPRSEDAHGRTCERVYVAGRYNRCSDQRDGNLYGENARMARELRDGDRRVLDDTREQACVANERRHTRDGVHLMWSIQSKGWRKTTGIGWLMQRSGRGMSPTGENPCRITNTPRRRLDLMRRLTSRDSGWMRELGVVSPPLSVSCWGE